jgi:hypothetical protein
MRLLKRTLMGIGALALVASLLTLMAPKSVHAAVAALVQVTNTTANPAITLDADKATQIPYQSTQQFTAIGGALAIPVTFAQVPSGYRLVIENVNTNFTLSLGSTPPFGEICTLFNKSVCFPSFTGTALFSLDGVEAGIINQQVTRYVGPGDTPYVIFTADTYQANGTNTATLTGHLIDCSVAGCPAITE